MICDDLAGHLQAICLGQHVRDDGSTFTPYERSVIVSRSLRRTVTEDELPEAALQHVHRKPKQRAASQPSTPEPSVPSTLGTRLREAIEASIGNLSGDVRRYLALLNKPQRHDAETIHVRIVAEVPDIDQAWLGLTIARLMQDTAVGKHLATVTHSVVRQPDVSTLGTRLRSAIEAAGEYTLTCGFCKAYLASLNKTDIHSAEQIVKALQWELQIPEKIRGVENLKQARTEWLRAIVESVIADDGPKDSLNES